MRLERMSYNKFKIFLTFDDLLERGLTKEDLWYDLPSVHQLFHDMMFEATDELGIELEGVLQVQVHLMHAQGMLIVVTQSDVADHHIEEDYVEMNVTLDECKEMMFAFSSFEDIILVSQHLHDIHLVTGAVYYMDDTYYMQLDEHDLLEYNHDSIIAIMSEFSSPTTVTSHRLTEYGKVIMPHHAVKNIVKYFIH
ncbi:genetic competence negative regulator [Pontibacillus litoralis]|uniref:Adaptor protein n=1 Tax=Pontibacillus litoralis JSM 072002 TaxID=1385512 RepID=A0A0A5GA80_9BACI|nr:genetic competence negative regulator [Pontibacillus litoralis]KGX87990.1 adaptor protein [Pontibacillus litoralis JSM 072002]